MQVAFLGACQTLRDHGHVVDCQAFLMARHVILHAYMHPLRQSINVVAS